ncbi:MAG TPA: prolyl oligopeptidase family serine peptidase [Phycisphaerales bacterium]|nr:prolyl oligopeptidase family serine peptidase [Phycisphaerales bacterium]
MRSVMKNLVAVCVLLGASSPVVADLTLRADAKSLALSDGLAIDSVSQWARRPINIDGVVAAMVDGVLGDPTKNPRAGDTLPIPAALLKEGGPTTAAWKEAKGEVKGEGMQASGTFGEMGRGTYVLFAVHSERERVMMLEASGHGVAYVNGEPRVGDPYSFGYVRLPILLHEGANQIILQHANRGELRARIEEPQGEVEFNERDLTLPDIIGSGRYHFAVPVINATTNTVPLTISVTVPASGEAATALDPMGTVSLVTLQPLSVTKLPLEAVCGGEGQTSSAVRVRGTVRVIEGGTRVVLDRAIQIPHAKPAERHKRTYTSDIDGSVQYVSVVPPLPDDAHTAPGLVLSVHGASVEATSQAASYAAKQGLVIACPTNRRPFGFDWEDWGRIDALEAMDFVTKEFKTDPRRQYLTGHSMGGHGTWQLGCLYPERFAAIAPSAGWLSFSTYMSAVGQKFGPVGDDPVMQKFREVISLSDTISLLPRLRGEESRPKGIYILHGDADDNVPVSEARRAREELTKLSIPFEFHEQPGAGHWWDDDAVKKANVGPEGQTKWGAVCVDWPPMFEMFAKHLLPEKPDAAAQPASPLGPDHFHPGSFKRVFNNRFVLVYGTRGTEEEVRWAYAKARFDAEQWWYRGNGTARVARDDEFLEDWKQRRAAPYNLILYGNGSLNAAWGYLDLPTPEPVSPAAIARGRGAGAPHRAWVMTRVDPDHASVLVGTVGGNSLKAMRATDRLSYFSAGVDYPSVTVLSPDIWTVGEAGVIGAGFVREGDQVNEDAVEWRPD